MTEPVQGKHKESKCTSEDIINNLPKNIIADILERMPIQDAVKTSILSRNWRFHWTMLTRLVFDQKFFEYLGKTGASRFFRRILNRMLLHLKGVVTEFILYIPENEYIDLDVEDINHLVLFLSTKGMKKFTLINMRETPLKLPTHLSSCLELKHLKLHNCCIHPAPGFCGFLKLKNFEFHNVIFEKYTAGKFVTGCPVLERLEVHEFSFTDKVKPFQIAKLQNLKMLSLSLCKLDTIAITSSDVFQLMVSLPKLEDLHIDFRFCKFLAEASGGKKFPTALHCLRTLKLNGMDFSSSAIVFCAFHLICSSPNLHTLKITATNTVRVSQLTVCSQEAYCGMMKQLEIVKLKSIGGSKNEIDLIKFLLAYSPFLKKMIINRKCHGFHKSFTFASKLLKLHRASTIAEIDLN